MIDESAVLRMLDELLWMLRRAGIVVATSQAIDVVRAVRLVGFSSRDMLREAIAAVVVQRPRERARFDAAFDDFFAHRARRDLWERLAEDGLTSVEIDDVKLLLETYAKTTPQGTLGALVRRGAELDRLLQLASAARALEGMQSPLQAGFFTHKLLEQLGTWRAKSELEAFRARLTDAFGAERAEVVLRALEREITLASDDARAFVQDTLERRALAPASPDDVLSAPLVSLDEEASREVRRAVRVFVERLRGGESVRRRRARRGRIDVRATLRRSMRTGGVPFDLARKARRRDKPKLVVLCDVSESVRSVAAFMLELTFAAQSLFSGTRSFVFVSELGETTRLFDELPPEAALARAVSGAVVPITHNSNYGRALRAFRDGVLRDVDRRTTVVIVGDGRSNYQDPGVSVLDDIVARARALVWLCPEPRAAWATGDSAMPRYAPKCTAVLEVRSARDLEEAARLVRSLR